MWKWSLLALGLGLLFAVLAWSGAAAARRLAGRGKALGPGGRGQRHSRLERRRFHGRGPLPPPG